MRRLTGFIAIRAVSSSVGLTCSPGPVAKMLWQRISLAVAPYS